MNVIEFIKYRIERDEVRMIDVNGTSYYSATDIDNLLDYVDKIGKRNGTRSCRKSYRSDINCTAYLLR